MSPCSHLLVRWWESTCQQNEECMSDKKMTVEEAKKAIQKKH